MIESALRKHTPTRIRILEDGVNANDEIEHLLVAIQTTPALFAHNNSLLVPLGWLATNPRTTAATFNDIR